jgi:energy-coupling factor transporter ATP-binding protein EcfA2
MNTEKISANSFFAEMHQHISTLLRETPILHSNLKQTGALNLDTGADFTQLKKLPSRHVEIAGKPVIIMALVGPSGAGKSTIFNLVTGLETPAGGDVRPMTFASTVAVPQAIYEEFDQHDIFPQFQLTELSSPNDLRNRQVPASLLFKAAYQQPESDFWLCLVDIPDFNTTETTNWNKAEQMIERADAIIFTVYTEAYKDQMSYNFLKRCCRLSGSLTYVLTKIDSQSPANSAGAVRDDLLAFAGKDKEFNELRANKQTMVSYLQNSPFYYSARSSKPTLHEIMPLANTQAEFTNFLFKQEGMQTILAHYLQSISIGVSSCRKICELAESKSNELHKKLEKIDKQVGTTAQKVVGEEFPVFYILQMIKKLLEENRPSWIKRLISPVTMLGSTLKSVISGIHAKVRNLKHKEITSGVAVRNQLERERLLKLSELLVEKWRESEVSAELTAESCRKRLANLQNAELPPVDEEWELFVREKLENWIKSNKNRWMWFNVINDISIFLGTGLVMADIFIDGGFGTLGVVAAVGGSGALAGFLSSLFTNLGLGLEISQAHKKWKELRQQAYINFLKNQLARPLFLEKIEQQSKNLNTKRIEKCRSASDELKEISKKYEHGKD